jgi:nitroimidazol reductase NimA-like FMN-containing flavoprotein (pyridoxamine 5'-phosphate oxidase superfamily)
MSDRFEPTEATRVRRRPQRASYDKAVVFAILDAGLVCHLAYVVDGRPFCTPTAYWREGERLYWHGSAASRMLDGHARGIPVCLTVSHLDGLVLSRSGFTHSVNYRSVMAFGHPALVTDQVEKRRASDAFIERLAPGRTREIRPAHDRELEAISVIGMRIEEASAKVRDAGVLDPDSELGASCWAGVVPVAMTVGPIVPDPRLPAGVPVPPGLAAYTRGARLDDVLTALAAQPREATASQEEGSA